MKKKKMFAILGVMVLLLVGITRICIGDSKYSEEEFKVQKQVIDTFNLEVSDSKDALKPLFMRDIYDNEVATESKETRIKVAMAIESLQFSEGDFKPIIFLDKENDEVLIAVKHPNNTITLTKFDISKDISNLKKGLVILDKQVKEIKSEREDN